MKRSIYTVVLALTFLSLAPAVRAAYLVHSVAYPRYVTTIGSIFHIGLNVEGKDLSQISILIPDNAPGRLKITDGIEVSDQTGQRIAATTSFDGKLIKIDFAQPVPIGTTLEIDLKRVQPSNRSGRIWLLPIYGKSVGSTQSIQLGTARIQTSR